MSVADPLSAPDLARDLDALRARLAASDEASAFEPLGLGGVVLGRGALHRVAAVVAELRGSGGEVVMIADRRPMSAPAGEVKATVVQQLEASGIPVRRVEVGDEHADTHADAPTIDAAAAAVRRRERARERRLRDRGRRRQGAQRAA